VNQKLEAVDKRNPSLVRAATLAEVNEYRLRIHFDGWDDIYDDWFEADSLDLYPVGWCEKTGHPLETPLSKCFVSPCKFRRKVYIRVIRNNTQTAVTNMTVKRSLENKIH